MSNVQICLRYLHGELWAGNTELLWGQCMLLTGCVLQDNCKVDHVVSHYVPVLGWKDLLLQHLNWKERRTEKRITWMKVIIASKWKPPKVPQRWNTVNEWRVNVPSMGASCMTPCVSQKVFMSSVGLWLYFLAWAFRFTLIILFTLCLFMTFTVKEMGSPATGALSRFRKTSSPSDGPAE